MNGWFVSVVCWYALPRSCARWLFGGTGGSVSGAHPPGPGGAAEMRRWCPHMHQRNARWPSKRRGVGAASAGPGHPLQPRLAMAHFER